MSGSSRRSGFTLAELLMALVILALVGTALTKLLLGQGRFFSQQDALRDARSATRASLNMIMSDLRMVDARGGVVAAAAQDITVRVPYAFGVVCTSSAGVTVVSLLPTDAAMIAAAALSGYAWRSGASGNYTYVEGGVALTSGTASTCTGNSITTLAGGAVVSLTPGAASAQIGDAVFLFQRIRYQFASSSAVPGALGLWRTQVTPGIAEELVAPFESRARFRFFVLDADTAQSAVPASLSDIRGFEVVLAGASRTAPAGRLRPSTYQLTTAVFFKNRAN